MKVTIDALAGAAYIELNDAPVARTKELSEIVLVDLDEYNVVVGIELLSPATAPRVREITQSYHVSTECAHRLDQVLDTVRELRITGGQPTKPHAGGNYLNRLKARQPLELSEMLNRQPATDKAQ